MPTSSPSRSTARSTSIVLLAAFTLSAIHTGYAAAAGLSDPGFTPAMPTTWLFYGIGLGAAWLARRPRRWTHVVLLTYLVGLLAVSVFYYPTTFTAEQQSTFGWFENDVYVGLLMIATYQVGGEVVVLATGSLRPEAGRGSPDLRPGLR